MENEKKEKQYTDVIPDRRSDADKELDPSEVAESKRSAWEKEQEARG
ncbi:MAG TPA: hypothetical protein VFK33_00810 [Bacillales bacterium]|nr:hypothetical protein [Bacillales bacterium]